MKKLNIILMVVNLILIVLLLKDIPLYVLLLLTFLTICNIFLFLKNTK